MYLLFPELALFSKREPYFYFFLFLILSLSFMLLVFFICTVILDYSYFKGKMRLIFPGSRLGYITGLYTGVCAH